VIGTQSKDILNIQKLLNNFGYNVTKTGEETGYYGIKTDKALKQLQKDIFSGELVKKLDKVQSSIVSNSHTIGSSDYSQVFSRNLDIHTKGEDVRSLQVFLNTHGFQIAKSGDGSSGHETDLLGTLTMKALARFQKVNNISPANGFFGPKTRAYIIKNY